MFKKTILSILLIAVLTTGLFAFGSKEQVVKNVPVYVQSMNILSKRTRIPRVLHLNQ